MNPKDRHSFVKAVPRRSDLGYVVCANRAAVADRIEHSVLLDWEAGQFQEITPTPWLTADLCVSRLPMEQMIAVGEFGDVIIFGSGESHDEVIGTAADGPRTLGPLRGARAIGGLAYAVGMKRQVYLRDEKGQWARLEGIAVPDPGHVVGFEAIDGFGHDELYAVGWKGEIWNFDGKKWTSLHSSTNLILTDVCCASDGNVYVCGQQGLLLRGRHDEWSVIDTDDYQFDYWGLTFFLGSLYVAGAKMLLQFDGDSLHAVDTGPDRATTFGYLRHIDEVMWSTGADALMAFDGATWNRLA